MKPCMADMKNLCWVLQGSS